MNVSINYVTWFGPLGISKGRSTIHIWRNIYTNICRIYWRGNQEYQRTMFASNYYLRVWILFFVFISLKFNHLSSFSVHDFSRYVAPSPSSLSCAIILVLLLEATVELLFMFFCPTSTYYPAQSPGLKFTCNFN